VQWYVDHDSNRLLTPINEEADNAAWLTIDTVFKRATETGEIDAHPEILIQQFSGNSGLDSTNGSLQLSAMHKGETFSYNASAGYSDNSTLISELANSGIIDASARQEAANGSVGLTDQFTELQRVGLQGTYANVKYPNGEPVGLIGYRDPGISATYAYALSPQTTLSAIASGSWLTAPDIDFGSRDEGARVAWSRILTATTSVSASVGIIRTHIGSQEVNGSVWGVQGTHNSELAQWSFSLTRDVVPSGLGLLIRRDELDLSVVRNIAPRLDATVSILAAHNSDLVASFTEDDRRYLTGSAGFNWHASSQWVLSLTLRGSEARVPTEVERLQLATGWQTVLTLTWTPQPWTRSR
jgi:archaellin